MMENTTDAGKCTHQYDETQGNTSTQALSTKIVFFECKKRDMQTLAHVHSFLQWKVLQQEHSVAALWRAKSP